MTKMIPLLFAFVSLPALAADDAPDCQNAMTTMEINQCAQLELESVEAEMHRYLDAALNRHEADASLVESIQQAQEAWEGYRQAHCDAVYTQWRDGTIRGVMSLSCKKQLTQAHTHTLWESFLVTMEGGSLLPEPER
ncbi:lysozyme inhibitor LprI family protein [Halomonas sp. AOP13-D3-9]